MDFSNQPYGIMVEVKKIDASRGRHNKQVAGELIIDRARYSKLSGVTRLMCPAYDPEHAVVNPTGFEADLSHTDGLPTDVFVRPRL